jgi:hypothetical protein
MKKVFCFAGIALSLFASGCAIHPVPQDVTGVDTYHIVRQIRCEARETIRLEVIRWLNKMAAFGDPFAQQLALQYESDPDSISGFHYNLFSRPDYVRVRSVAKLFYDTGIAYNFDLTMTEDNDLAGGLTFTRPVLNPVFTLGVGAGAKRQRSNHRTFLVTDTFSYLLTKLNNPVNGQRYCDGQLVGPNYVYPIAGRIGIDKMVRDFIELTLFASLSEPTAKPGDAGAPTMADELTFTTSINGSVNPVAVFTPVSNAFQLTNASLTADADRIDVHKVAVALAITPSGMTELGSVRSYLFSSDRGARTAGGAVSGNRHLSAVVVGARVTGGARSPAEALAIIAIDQLKSRELQLIPPP